jgi:dethiobiotin synthetase
MSSLDDLIDRIVEHPAVVVVGTGTGVGKTVVTGRLLGEMSLREIPSMSMKWVQTGLDVDPLDTLKHDNIARGVDSGYSAPMTPKERTVYRLPMAASPHLAARVAGVAIDANRCWEELTNFTLAVAPVLVEGVGGVLVPMTRSATLLDWISMWQLPVIVVATDQLGTLNATALTLEAIDRRRIEILGVVVSSPSPDDTLVTMDNRSMIAAMAQRIDVPMVRCLFAS